MQLFRQFPKIFYTLVPGQAPVVVTNIMARVKVRQKVLSTAVKTYPYQIKETDTPDIIAAKYYDDPNRFWLVLAANDICDPYYDWPLPYDVFQKFIVGKYGSIQAAQTTTHHYEKWINKVDSASRQSTTEILQIDQATYDALPVSQVSTLNLQNGKAVTITITKNLVPVWDYEYNLNEAKRNIRIIDKAYIGQIEAELIAAFNG